MWKPTLSRANQVRELAGRLLHEVLDHVLVAEEVGSLDRVEGVVLERVVRASDRGRAALRGHRVAPHRVDLRHERHVGGGIRVRDGDGGAQPGCAAAHDDGVVTAHFHLGRPPKHQGNVKGLTDSPFPGK
jgi:hypothetical protein